MRYNILNFKILKMAQVISVSVYGKNSLAIGTNAGLTLGLPVHGMVVEPSAQSFNGVTMAAKISYVGEKQNTTSDEFYTATAVSTLVTAANA
jgi:hypothetical protein